MYANKSKNIETEKINRNTELTAEKLRTDNIKDEKLLYELKVLYSNVTNIEIIYKKPCEV